MATLRQTQNRIDNWLTVSFLPAMGTLQARYLNARGRYWQGLPTHEADVIDHTSNWDDDRQPTRFSTKPTDQSESWADELPTLASADFPAVVTVDVYEGPQGHGYTVTTVFRYDGVGHRRVINVGAESARTQSWARIPPNSLNAFV